jgi:hypothetical protein
MGCGEAETPPDLERPKWAGTLEKLAEGSLKANEKTPY